MTSGKKQIPRNISNTGIRKLLYRTDPYETSRHAFAYVASIAGHYKDKLTVFHVVNSAPQLEKSLADYISEDLREQLRRAT